MRLPLIAGNWKMNSTASEAVQLVQALRQGLDRVTEVESLVCPPFTALQTVSESLRGSAIKLGAQNLFYEERGAYTGEVSAVMVAEFCEYVILGHSERRQYFAETDAVINKKVIAALNTKLKPILCVGEKLEENESGKTRSVLTRQIEGALRNVSDLNSLVIAYEPVWAIGTGRAATGKNAGATIEFIRSEVARLRGDTAAQTLRVLYGGSVTAGNAAEFMEQPQIDGALVGGASLKPVEFISIVTQTAQIRGRS